MIDSYIYADNAATTKIDKDALKDMNLYLENYYGNPSSLYSLASKSRKAIENARQIIASAIGASKNEIFYTSGGTEGNNWAIKRVAYSRKEIGKHIIVSAIEHHSVINTCKKLEDEGYEISYIPVDENGIIDAFSLIKLLRNDTILVSIMYVNNEIGTIQNINDIVKIVKNTNALFHCDAVQAVGHLYFNVTELGIDLLSASAHKFNGPKGVGFMYKKSGLMIGSLIEGGSQELCQRAGTENVAGIVGMATALKKNMLMINTNSKHLMKISKITLDILKRNIPNIKINGSITSRIPGNINISLVHGDGEGLLHLLDMQGICVSTGSACNSMEKEVSHVIKAINVPKEYMNGTIRITYGASNTEKEAMFVAEKIVKYYKMQIGK